MSLILYAHTGTLKLMQTRVITRKSGGLIGLVCGFVLFVVAASGHEIIALPLAVSLCVICAVIITFADFRELLAFWIVFPALTLVHVLALWLVPWPSFRVARALLVPYFLVDFFVTLLVAYYALRKYQSK